ncbi:right-handed parallel beta-helix repeat-containing protein [Burkholderia sp. AW49-1]
MHRRKFLGSSMGVASFAAVGVSWAAACGIALPRMALAQRQQNDSDVIDASGPLSEDALQKRLMERADGRRVVVSRALRIQRGLVIPSGCQIEFLQTVHCAARAQAMFVDNGRSVHIRFVSIVGESGQDGQSAIVLRNSRQCTIVGGAIVNVRNKGIDIVSDGAPCDGNEVRVTRIEGATGKDGAGVSIFGTGAVGNRVIGGEFSKNRIGITINGGQRNEVAGVTCNNNDAAGIMIDGMATGAGDGGKYNTIHDAICNLNGRTTNGYGGVYLGNGSSFNRIEHVKSQDNRGDGCRMSGGSGYENKNNVFVDFQADGNAGGGFVASASPRTQLVGIRANHNAGHGIHLFHSDGCAVSGSATGNGKDGLLLQSAGAVVNGFDASSNLGYGIQVANDGPTSESVQVSGFRGIGNRLGASKGIGGIPQ